MTVQPGSPRQRITYIHQHFKPPSENGGGRPFEFARRLAQSGHHVTMFAAGSTSRTYELEGFKVVEIPTSYDNKMSVPRRILSFIDFMVRSSVAASTVNADIVFASSTPLTVAVPGIIASRLQRCRFVLEIRDLWPKVPIEMGFLPRWAATPATLLERLAYREADHVIALSPDMASGVRSINGKTSISMIPNASDTGEADAARPRALVRDELGIPDNRLLFYYAGSLGIGYDPMWLARLAIALHRHDASLVVLGAGAGTEPAQKLVEQAGLNAGAVFLGPTARGRVFDVAGAADVAVSTLVDHPALEGNSLNKVFDAMAAGRPVVFNHDGWLSDLLCESRAGWKWPRDLESADITKLLAPLRNPKSLEAACANSRSLAVKRFQRDALYAEFESALVTSKTG